VHGFGCFDCYDFRKGDLLVILAAGVILEQGDGFCVQAPVMTFALKVKMSIIQNNQIIKALMLAYSFVFVSGVHHPALFDDF
jgi:hypothetical protein